MRVIGLKAIAVIISYVLDTDPKITSLFDLLYTSITSKFGNIEPSYSKGRLIAFKRVHQ